MAFLAPVISAILGRWVSNAHSAAGMRGSWSFAVVVVVRVGEHVAVLSIDCRVRMLPRGLAKHPDAKWLG